MKKFWQYLKIIIILFLLYFQLIYWQNLYVGLILFTVYCLLLTFFWQTILRRVLAIENNTWLNKILSVFVVFTLLGIISAIFIVFYKLTPLCLWLSYLIAALFSFVLFKLFNKRVKEHEANDDEELILFRKNIIYRLSPIAYFILWLIAAYLLFKSQSTAALQSPWQTISKYYLPIFFILTVLSGIFLFVKFKTKTVLFVLVLQALLLHLYLPLSHQQPWGGDVWRHVAVEERIQSGERILPMFSVQKFSYGHLWGASVLLSETLNIDLLAINKWLMPILWSFVAPFLFFRLGYLIFDSRRKGLWLAWLALLPFPLQALGALALPVSFDFLLFLFVLALWLQYWRDHYRSQKYLALLFSVLMFLGYSLYFVLILAVVVLSQIANYFKSQITDHRSQVINKIIWTILIFLSFFIIPIIELVTKVSYLPHSLNLILNLKQLAGQFSGWFYANAIRPHDILSGNIIFNHTPDYAFVESTFNNWRWWLIPAMLVMWILVALGLYRMAKFQISNFKFQIIGLLFSTVFGGYLIGWFVLDGDRLLTRRLDMALAFLLMILVIQGLSFLLSKFQISNFKFQIKIITIVMILLFSWFTTFTHASGPDMRVVSVDEFEAAKYIEINRDKEIGDRRYCVLADTWVLLPLESLSSGKVVGGGFPIDYQFSQPERVTLYEEYRQNPREELIEQAKEITGAEDCWVVGAEGLKNMKK